METTSVHSNKTELKDRILWYDGDSTVEESEITRLLSLGLPVDGMFVEQLTDDIRQFNTLVPTNEQIGVKDEVGQLRFDWNIPDEYKTLSIDEFVVDKLNREFNRHSIWKQDEIVPRVERVAVELELYLDMGLNDVLRALIYIINTLQANDIVWGVGRGSSVSSYILYLIGVHDVDSVEYELDITDFLRVE